MSLAVYDEYKLPILSLFQSNSFLTTLKDTILFDIVILEEALSISSQCGQHSPPSCCFQPFLKLRQSGSPNQNCQILLIHRTRLMCQIHQITQAAYLTTMHRTILAAFRARIRYLALADGEQSRAPLIANRGMNSRLKKISEDLERQQSRI